MTARTTAIDDLQTAFPGLAASEFRGQTRVVVPVESLLRCSADAQGEAWASICWSMSRASTICTIRDASGPLRPGLSAGQHARPTSGSRCGRFVNDPEPTVPSVVELWEGANWLEREVWDMFGIRFAGHPDLRRILLPEEFTAHPLRKDYPLQGRGERHNFPVITRRKDKLEDRCTILRSVIH